MRIKTYFFLYTLVYLCSCGIKSSEQKNTNKNIGNQKDVHGCINSAGYTWSELKQNCIRPFEEGITLTEISPKETYKSATFIVFNNEHSQAEIFTASERSSVILSQNKLGQFTNNKYLLKKENSTWVLYINNKMQFRENKKVI